MRLGSALIFLSLFLAGCAPSLPASRVAVDRRQLPPVREDKALVIFMFPPCARYSGPTLTDEEKLLCRVRRRNRIRVAEQGARLVTDFGVDQYGASYEEPGRHLYGAYHHFDHCTWDRTDCVAALKANLLPGQIYFVTFRWNHILTGGGRSLGLTYGRLEITPVSAERESIFRERLAEIDRVEPNPDYREPGPIVGLRSAYVSTRALDRLAQDRKDGAPIPHLGGRVTVEELPVEAPKKEETPPPAN
jgi:hypothetical protein